MKAFEFTPVGEAEVRTIELAGRLDSLAAPEFDRKIAEIEGARVVLDLSRLEYISSVGLRSVLGAQRRANATGAKIALAAPSPSVVETFEISGFITLVSVARQSGGFASYLGVSKVAIIAWEYGQRKPSGAARKLLSIAKKNPPILVEV